MNPSFIAWQKAMIKQSMNLFMGIPHEPKTQKPVEEGPAFAPTDRANEFPRSDLIVMAEEEQKERDTRAHLDQLAKEARKRAATDGNLDEPLALRRYTGLGAPGKPIPMSKPNCVEEEAERQLADEIHAKDLLDKTTAAFKASQAKRGLPSRLEAAAFYGSDNGAKIDETSTHDEVLEALHRAHKDYTDRVTSREAWVKAEMARNAALDL